MKPFTLFISYLQDPLISSWKKMSPLPIQAQTEEEASRTAIAVADFAYPEFARELLIQIVGNGDDGRPVGEIRRPRSTEDR